MFTFESYYKPPINVLGTGNAKTIKGEKLGYKTYILYLAPAAQNSRAKTLCPHSTDGCRKACLYSAGRGQFHTTQKARLNKTEYFLNARDAFMNQIVEEIKRGVRTKGAKNICVRLNGTSDIPFEKIKVGEYKNIMEMFPDVQFYDYTKAFYRLTKTLPDNYHLTFSYAETAKSQREAMKALELGFNVAAVFNIKDASQLPATFKGYPVVNGDEHDLMFLRPKGVIIGLKAKGQAKKDQTGFVIKDF